MEARRTVREMDVVRRDLDVVETADWKGLLAWVSERATADGRQGRIFLCANSTRGPLSADAVNRLCGGTERPMPGDVVVALRNDHATGIFAGEICAVEEDGVAGLVAVSDLGRLPLDHAGGGLFAKASAVSYHRAQALRAFPEAVAIAGEDMDLRNLRIAASCASGRLTVVGDRKALEAILGPFVDGAPDVEALRRELFHADGEREWRISFGGTPLAEVEASPFPVR